MQIRDGQPYYFAHELHAGMVAETRPGIHESITAVLPPEPDAADQITWTLEFASGVTARHGGGDLVEARPGPQHGYFYQLGYDARGAGYHPAPIAHPAIVRAIARYNPGQGAEPILRAYRDGWHTAHHELTELAASEA